MRAATAAGAAVSEPSSASTSSSSSSSSSSASSAKKRHDGKPKRKWTVPAAGILDDTTVPGSSGGSQSGHLMAAPPQRARSSLELSSTAAEDAAKICRRLAGTSSSSSSSANSPTQNSSPNTAVTTVLPSAASTKKSPRPDHFLFPPPAHLQQPGSSKKKKRARRRNSPTTAKTSLSRIWASLWALAEARGHHLQPGDAKFATPQGSAPHSAAATTTAATVAAVVVVEPSACSSAAGGVMTAEGPNVDATLLGVGEQHGHRFTRRTFTKPAHCHHCCDKIWGMLTQGYVCDVCNFVCHDKCARAVVSYCSSVALQLIKNPVAHSWSEPAPVKRRFCAVCRRRTDEQPTLACEVCDYYVHVECEELAVSDCREAATFAPSLGPDQQQQQHHVREAVMSRDARCCVCRKSFQSYEYLAGVRCEWCGRSVHAACLRAMPVECDYGPLRKIMLPPNCLTIPRTELPMDRLLNITSADKSSSSASQTAAMSGLHSPATASVSATLGAASGSGAGAGTTAGSGEQLSTSPLKITADDVSTSLAQTSLQDDDIKEKDDSEVLRVFDGNASLRAQQWRAIRVPKTASVQQIRDAALRRFHIHDNADNYYVTQLVSEESLEEETLDDPVPLRNVRRPEGRRAQLLLRYREGDDESSTNVRLYGGWLRVPVTFCSVPLTRDTLVQDALSEALDAFGLDRAQAARYNLVEVSLAKGVAERTCNHLENMLQLVRNLRKDSLRRAHVVRFYVQEKEDPHDHAVFVANLPTSGNQRQYERILLKLLGVKEKPFTAIGPIYFEYGSLIVTFNSAKAATTAVEKLQNAVYEDKKLLVLCLPNVQPHMLPDNMEPLLVLVNVKSGGCQGNDLLGSFRKLLNPFQVFDLLKGGPLVGLYVFRNIPKYKILACGGDGTIGWVLQCLDFAKQDAACFSPPCGIVPLGTGNDLARVLRWGGGYTGDEDPLEILKDVIEADEVQLDRWAVVLREEERAAASAISAASSDPSSATAQSASGTSVVEAPSMANPEDQTSMIIMNNYFGIGIDADVCLKFHNKRDANPEKFQSRLFNKTQYVKIGIQKAFFDRSCKDLYKRIELEVDGKPIELPQLEGIIVLNLLSWGSGANPWGTAKEEAGFQKPTHYDGLLEVVGIPDVTRLGLIQSKMGAGVRIAQGGSVTPMNPIESETMTMQIRITTHDEWPVQVDGEPHIQPAGTITILKSALKAQMLKKAKKRRGGGVALSSGPGPSVSSVGSASSSAPPVRAVHSGPIQQQPEERSTADDDDDAAADAFL